MALLYRGRQAFHQNCVFFENVDVILCAFHTLKTFRIETMRITDSPTKTAIRETFKKLIYAKTDKMFYTAYDHLVDIAPHDFPEYFDKNWNNCKGMWSAHQVNKVAHLGNRRTNHLESFHQKLKDHLHHNITLGGVSQDS